MIRLFIPDQDFFPSRIRIQDSGVLKHWIPDRQHCLPHKTTKEGMVALAFFIFLVQGFLYTVCVFSVLLLLYYESIGRMCWTCCQVPVLRTPSSSLPHCAASKGTVASPIVNVLPLPILVVKYEAIVRDTNVLNFKMVGFSRKNSCN
jgi:hypothetical protein